MNIALPKWPALIVVGDPVDPKQARDIIRRTDDAFCHVSTNDHEWEELVATKLYNCKHRDYAEIFDRRDELIKALGNIHLSYLHNSRISSCWIGGFKGWVDWDGTIGCRNYNIGKWPSCGGVLADWTAIAAAFPYLRLTAQLLSGETCEDDSAPLVEYVVEDGAVTMQEPTKDLGQPVDPPYLRLFDRSYQDHISWEQLRDLINEALPGRAPL